MKKHPIAELIKEIESLATCGARFVSLEYTAKGTGEVARHTIALGVSISNAYKRDLVILRNLMPTLKGSDAIACQELMDSLSESLTKGIGNNSAYTCKDVYKGICNGVKLHLEKGELHVTGFGIAKTVIEPGVYKTVKSSDKTLAKNALRKRMKSGKFRQFALSELGEIKINGKTIELA